MIDFKDNTYYKLSRDYRGEPDAYIVHISGNGWIFNIVRYGIEVGKWLPRSETHYKPIDELQHIIIVWKYKVEELNENDLLLELL